MLERRHVMEPKLDIWLDRALHILLALSLTAVAGGAIFILTLAHYG